MKKVYKNYIERYKVNSPYIKELPKNDLFIVIVIPCYNEPDLVSSLKSINNCIPPENSVEVITVINSSENSNEKIKNQNLKTLQDAQETVKNFSNKKVKFRFILKDDLPKKDAGVGLARKIGMDEALHRFALINKPDGIICGFDADSKVSENYLTEIEKHFLNNSKTKACSVNFEHPIEGDEFEKEIYDKIISYELHLRYFINALRYINFPFAHQTIGSSFGVRAEEYAKQGGMNKKKAGEDFYFLQKFIVLGNYSELNTCTVFPSPRISDRVPFGTGAAIKSMINENQNSFMTYCFKTFQLLEMCFNNIDLLYENDFNSLIISEKIPTQIINFITAERMDTELPKIKKKSPSFATFRNNFFRMFNTFKVIKFLNDFHRTEIQRCKTGDAVKEFFKAVNIPVSDSSEKSMLLKLREIDKSN